MNYDRNAVNGKPIPKQVLNHNQIVLQSKLRVSQSGIEMLDFVIPLGVMELHCSVPIPDEGTDGSPVYVHVKPTRQSGTMGAVGPAPKFRRQRINRSEDSEEIDEVEEDYGNRA